LMNFLEFCKTHHKLSQYKCGNIVYKHVFLFISISVLNLIFLDNISRFYSCSVLLKCYMQIQNVFKVCTFTRIKYFAWIPTPLIPLVAGDYSRTNLLLACGNVETLTIFWRLQYYITCQLFVKIIMWTSWCKINLYNMV
jgi:hypothetical protein